MAIERLRDIDRASELTDLLHQAYSSDEKLGIHFGAAHVSEEDVEQHILHNPTFVAIENGEIAATVSFRLPWADNPGPFVVPHLGWVATNPNYQHQGHAKRLIEWVIKNYVQFEIDSPAVSLGTALEHPWLSHAYEKLGFKKVDVVRKFEDHQTLYLLKILDHEQFKLVNDEHLHSLLEDHVNE